MKTREIGPPITLTQRLVGRSPLDRRTARKSIYTMSIEQSREVRLRSRPDAVPVPENFSFETISLPEPGPGEVQVQNLFMSVDPYMRGRMRDRPSYVPPFQVGKALEGGAVGRVVRSNHERLKVGDTVVSMLGWREAFNAPGDGLQTVDADRLAPEAYLGTAGMPGMTAYVGLLHVIKIKAGETLFVSAAAGAVGSVVCQVAKIKGATVIGSAGGAEKCAFLREIGVDHAVDYKEVDDLTATLSEAAPEGIDAYFDNVGGTHLEAALSVAKPFARFALCGMIAGYNGQETGPANLIFAVGKRLLLQGFLVSDHTDLRPAFLHEMTTWIQTGKVTSRQTVDEGIEQAPAAFLKLFTGENIGKMLVKLR
ncbi:MAG TPA: NADP-dependent oxidoreductase [Chthoniobacterales bacterium]